MNSEEAKKAFNRGNLIIGIAFILFLLIFFIVLAFQRSSYVASFPVYGVQRVLMHEIDFYTFLIREPNSTKLKSLSLSYHDDKSFVLISDVAPDKDMWLNLKCRVDPTDKCFEIEIHLHSAKDINGAGWNHGKFGKGQTDVVE